MAMPAVVESPRFRDATGVPHDIVALPPPLKSHICSEARGEARCVSDVLNETIVLTSENP